MAPKKRDVDDEEREDQCGGLRRGQFHSFQTTTKPMMPSATIVAGHGDAVGRGEPAGRVEQTDQQQHADQQHHVDPRQVDLAGMPLEV